MVKNKNLIKIADTSFKECWTKMRESWNIWKIKTTCLPVVNKKKQVRTFPYMYLANLNVEIEKYNNLYQIKRSEFFKVSVKMQLLHSTPSKPCCFRRLKPCWCLQKKTKSCINAKEVLLFWRRDNFLWALFFIIFLKLLSS